MRQQVQHLVNVHRGQGRLRRAERPVGLRVVGAELLSRPAPRLRAPCDALIEAFESASQVFQLAKSHHGTPPLTARHGRNPAAVDTRLGKGPGHHGHTGKMHVVADLEVTRHSDRTGNGAIATDAGRARNPEHAAMAVFSPICTLCPIWIRLSILTPSPITVSSTAPRSTVVLAPTSTSSPKRTRPSCGMRSQRSPSFAKPNP